jgi:lysophospholipase L1-like esterase
MRRNQNGYYLNQYAFAIQDMAAFWGVRVIDLLNEPELDFSSKQSVYLVDGLHPNPTGHALLGACVYRRLFENPY